MKIKFKNGKMTKESFKQYQLREYKQLTDKDKQKLKEEYEFALIDLETDTNKKKEELRQEYLQDIIEQQDNKQKRQLK
jgi:hypothetical protein